MSEYNHEEGKFTTSDGTEIYYQVWKPNGPPKGIVQLVHGIAEHTGRYMNVVNKLVPEGYIVCGMDLICHGKSGGHPGFVNKFSDFVEEQHEFTQLIRKKEDAIPIFLLGHSMGAIIAILHVVEYPNEFKGLILSGSGTKANVNLFLTIMARIMSKLLPKMTVKNEISDGICSDPAVKEAYDTDPLVLKKLSFRIGNELFRSYNTSTNCIDRIKIPLLIQKGEKDRVVLKADILFSKVTSQDSTFKEYSNLFHEVYNEPEKDREIVLSDLSNWLNDHL